MSDDGDFVTLNVGGTKFVSSKTTLCTKGSTEPSHFFSALLSGTTSSNPISVASTCTQLGGTLPLIAF
jgi:hypothetical protein